METNNRIREEWKNEFRKKFTIEETFYELYWKEENPLKIIDFISELLKSQREEYKESIKEERKRITGIIRQVGALENDKEVEKLIDIINEND